jgi:branched-chain amino acid transport system substrate-binding protein
VRRLGTGLWFYVSLASDKALAGAWFAAPDPGLRRDFERRYVDNYGLQPPRLATLAYDATALAAVLARNGWQQGGQVSFDREAIGNPNGFAGVDGVFRFRPDGLIERGLGVLEFRGGMISVVDPAPATFQGWMGQ